MRVQDEKIRLMKQAGVDSNEITAMKTKRAATYQEYEQFSEKMGLPEQMNRVFNSEVKHVKKTEEIPIEGSSSATKESLSPSPSSVYYITPKSINKSLGAVSKSEIPGTIDITDEWEHDESKPASECIHFDSSFELNGVKYQIDGIKVKYEYDDSRASYWRSDCA